MIGKSLSHFEITAKLGEGGMGEVYRATDTKLGREVAIKVLPEELASDPARLERFEREARAVAALDHPNIVTVHEIAQDGDTHFIAMQLVEGETLGKAIPAQGMKLEQIFATAIPIADALSAAHEAGVVHRDLKPGNIMLGAEGRVRILDFGLAKLHAAAAEADSTQLGTEVLTSEGQIIGTVAYMSPEQAEGKPVDQRSDIFSLGVLLYQMATGGLPFRGDTQISTITSILRDAPLPISQVRGELPWHLGRIVRRALEKDPERRYQTAKDLRNDLEVLKSELDSGELSAGGEELLAAAEPAAAREAVPRRWAGIGPWGLAALFLLAGLIAGYLLARVAGRGPAPADASAGVGLTQVSVGAGFESWPSLTPDGEWVVYGAREAEDTDIFLQSVGGYKPINLTEDSPVDDSQPALSPDGQLIAFRSERQGGGIFIMGRTGESVRRVSDFGFSPAWSPDGRSLVVATERIHDMPYSRGSVSQLWKLDLESGEKTLLTDGDAVEPSWSPGGERIAFWGLHPNTGQRDIWTIPASGGEPQLLTNDPPTDWSPSWSADGRHLYFASDRSGAMNIWRLPVDEASGQASGPPEQVTSGGAFWSVRPAFSRDGRQMAYSEGRWRYDVYRLPLDPAAGRAAGPVERVFGDSRNTLYPAISPDGEWLAFSTSVGQQEDLYVSRLDGSGLTRLTDDPAKDRGAKWSPDGERLAFYSDRSGIYSLWTISADGSGLERLQTPESEAAEVPVWSPDGSRIVYQVRDEVEGSFYASIFDLSRPAGENNPRPLPLPPAGKMNFSPHAWSGDGDRIFGSFSNPDGSPAQLAFYSLSSGEYQTFEHRAEGPLWLSDGRRAIFATDRSVELLDTATGETTLLATVGPGTFGEFPSISADDRWFYFTLATPEFDIWIAALGQPAR